MKVLILNFSDGQGGADRAAYRLLGGLRGLGVDARMLVHHKLTDDPAVIGPPGKIAKVLNMVRPHLEALPLKLYPGRSASLFSPAWLPGDVPRLVAFWKPDVVHLHWVCNGFLSIPGLARIRGPLVWTMHDAWAFTGGCHYPFDCRGYLQACGCCPQLGSRSPRDLSHRVWQRKAEHWRSLPLTIITPSRWLADCVTASALFRHVQPAVIPNGLDLTRYQPVDRVWAREYLGLPPDKKVILAGALNFLSDGRKGFAPLQEALQFLAREGWGEKAQLVLFGGSRPDRPPDMGLAAKYLGMLRDDISLALLYAAADVFVASSLQENLPNTIMEALACGTPVAAFHVGGISDLVDHRVQGYLTQAGDSADLARGISWVLADEKRHAELSRAARQKVEKNFALAHIARRHVDLYQNLVG